MRNEAWNKVFLNYSHTVFLSGLKKLNRRPEQLLADFLSFVPNSTKSNIKKKNPVKANKKMQTGSWELCAQDLFKYESAQKVVKKIWTQITLWTTETNLEHLGTRLIVGFGIFCQKIYVLGHGMNAFISSILYNKKQNWLKWQPSDSMRTKPIVKSKGIYIQ